MIRSDPLNRGNPALCKGLADTCHEKNPKKNPVVNPRKIKAFTAFILYKVDSLTDSGIRSQKVLPSIYTGPSALEKTDNHDVRSFDHGLQLSRSWTPIPVSP